MLDYGKLTRIKNDNPSQSISAVEALNAGLFIRIDDNFLHQIGGRYYLYIPDVDKIICIPKPDAIALGWVVGYHLYTIQDAAWYETYDFEQRGAVLCYVSDDPNQDLDGWPNSTAMIDAITGYTEGVLMPVFEGPVFEGRIARWVYAMPLDHPDLHAFVQARACIDNTNSLHPKG